MNELEAAKKVFDTYRKTIVKQFELEHEILRHRVHGQEEERLRLAKGWRKFIWSSALISIAISAFSFARPVMNCG